MRRRGAAAGARLLVVALLATLAHAGTTARSRRSLASIMWGKVTVVNQCKFPVAVVAAYAWDPKADGAHPCPNEKDSNKMDKSLKSCATEWLELSPGEKGKLPELPTGIWSYSAYITTSSPRAYLSNVGMEAFLAPPDDFWGDCVEPSPDCVWWGVPHLNAKSNRLVLDCKGYDPKALPLAVETQEMVVINKCPVPVEIKVAYQMAEGDKGVDCQFNEWHGPDHMCITKWRTLAADSEESLGETVNPFWRWGAHVAADPSFDIAKRAFGAQERSNHTTACPEEDVYGSGYVCEWWAPNCFFCDNITNPDPVVLTCDGYSVALPPAAAN